MCICILSHFRPTVRHARGRACGSRGGLAWGVAVAIHRWMLREPGRCGGCHVVLCKFKNFSRNRCCDSCSAKIKHGRNAYHCGTCWRFKCKQCTNASRRSSVPTSPRRPQLACGGCQGVLVDFRINYASVNRLCHSCSAAFECINKVAYYCDSCERIICRQCTRAIRLAAWRRSGAKRCVSPVRGLTGIHGLRYSRPDKFRKQPRLSPAVGTAESEVRTAEQQPVDTASADEHERAQMGHEDERAQIRHTLEIYREARAARSDTVMVMRGSDGHGKTGQLVLVCKAC